MANGNGTDLTNLRVSQARNNERVGALEDHLGEIKEDVSAIRKEITEQTREMAGVKLAIAVNVAKARSVLTALAIVWTLLTFGLSLLLRFWVN